MPASVWRRVCETAALLMMLLGACASLPPMPPRTVTRALDPVAATPLLHTAAGRSSPGLSGVRMLVAGEDALANLLLLADGAQRSLDLQYYAILNDASARVLMQRVRAAADRGVRVRLLVDDLNTSGTDDAFRRLTRHPRIEVRLYNPLPSGRMSAFTKVLGSLNDAARINSRMHNKAFIADNVIAVTGGRNIGDPYFLLTAEANFLDLDLLVAGPAVPSLSAVFDRFWNSELAYPIDAVIPAPSPAASPPATGASAPLDAPDELPEPARARVAQSLAQLRTGGSDLQWVPARVIADLPSKSLKEGEPAAAETMFDDLGALLRSAQHDVLIMTPYFVPGADGMALIESLRQRGVNVRVLTAALAATDAPVVHMGYSKYRKRLLAAGVELYELRPEFEPQPQRYGGVHSRTNLHAKAIMIDGRTVLVGSMNIDPRSDKHNTEMGLLLSSPTIARQLGNVVDHACETGAYRIVVHEDGQLRWRYTAPDGSTAELTSEPKVSLWKRIGLSLLAPLAPEQLL
jgi:phosphatidylserine/phosphatidylglycerophosphate/cardiolipin synthase-like enzyme